MSSVLLILVLAPLTVGLAKVNQTTWFNLLLIPLYAISGLYCIATFDLTGIVLGLVSLGYALYLLDHAIPWFQARSAERHEATATGARLEAKSRGFDDVPPRPATRERDL